MIKACKYCGRKFNGTPKKKYCSPRCKKNFENSLRSAPELRNDTGTLWDPSETICRPPGLNSTAAEFWEKVAPTVITRGHLNVLSEDAFAELCDLYSRLREINGAIDQAKRSAVAMAESASPSGEGGPMPAAEAAGLCEMKPGSDSRESALSDLKRKYSKQFLDYCREFYLTPRVNRGNFGLSEGDDLQPKDEIFD